MYREFHKLCSECALVFRYNHCSKPNSRKTENYWIGRAVCKADPRCIKVCFCIKTDAVLGEGVDVSVSVVGHCTHAAREDIENLQPTTPNRRFLSTNNRQAVAKTLHKTKHTPATLFDKKLASMTPTECSAGNTSTCQTKQVFRQALYEYERSKRLHDDVAVELDIMRDTLEAALPGAQGVSGYIQGLGLNPFYAVFLTKIRFNFLLTPAKNQRVCFI
jgi:hypothetical protein